MDENFNESIDEYLNSKKLKNENSSNEEFSQYENDNSEFESAESVMENYKSHEEPFSFGGYKIAALFAVIGFVLIGLNLGFVESSNKYFPYFWIVGFGLFGFAIGYTVCPGKKICYLSSALDIKEKFANFKNQCKAAERVVHWTFAILCLIASIFVSITEKFYLCMPICTIAILIGAVTISIKSIVIIIRSFTQTIEQKEEEDTEENYNLKNHVIALIVSLLVGLSCVGLLYTSQYALGDFFDGSASNPSIHHKASFDRYIKENMDKEVPIRPVFTVDKNSVEYVLDITELKNPSEDNTVSIIKVPLYKIISYIMANEGRRTLTLCEDESFSEYDSKSLSNMKYVKEYFEANPFNKEESYIEYLSSFSANVLDTEADEFYDDEVKLFIDCLDSIIVYSVPKLNDEYFCIWSMSSFVDYYNQTYGTEYEILDLIKRIYDHEFTDYGIYVSTIGDMIYRVYADLHMECGLIFNYGTEDSYFYTKNQIQKIVSKLSDIPEFMTYGEEDEADENADTEVEE